MKRFKYFFMALVLVIGLLGSSFTSAAEASSSSTGKAYIPYFSQTGADCSIFTVSNITDNTINIAITFYNSTGSIMTDDNNINTGTFTGTFTLLGYTEPSTSDCTMSFILNPHSTGYIKTNTYSQINNGYGIIEWSQNSSTVYGLVANGLVQKSSTSESRYTIPINCGMPF